MPRPHSKTSVDRDIAEARAWLKVGERVIWQAYPQGFWAGGEFRAEGPFDISLGHRPRNCDPNHSYPSANGALHRVR